jgi:hypothetical protein
MFTVEEITLLRSFDTSSRRAAILSLMNEMGMMQDTELISLCQGMVKKLEKTTDVDFYSVDFTVYDDDEVNETSPAGEVPGGEKEADNE